MTATDHPTVPGAPIEVRGLTKTFGGVTAVQDLSFDVRPGRVTGFLGPNGSGKTTTLRVLLGLVAPTAGTATIGGRAYRDLTDPLRTVGAALEAASFHPGRTARNHLRIQAMADGIDLARVQQVLDAVGMSEYADRRVGGYSMGMRQRLGLAGALLGDPGVLVLDEPINGLDPEGIRWIRSFLRSLAAQGRTVIVSSHMLGEVQQSVDDVVIIANGVLVRSGTIADLEAENPPVVLVDAPDRDALARALQEAGLPFTFGSDGFRVATHDAALVGHAAFVAGVELRTLHRLSTGLEDTFIALTTRGAAA
ncbi:ABC transporter ATP-binding protein [Serinibacter arcticus]|uniref:ABC transporter, ATP-binding protein n=1 Tax=Serinibacter arcticus TaxID=1655435 RepID=A0A4Z1DY45_9MICO|nr:ABC transporter ATP-binding protein [Serinibacter arcticus]TGO04466.1 ABC transporter, ATP-binding protein [Serinibacter arcticus]